MHYKKERNFTLHWSLLWTSRTGMSTVSTRMEYDRWTLCHGYRIRSTSQYIMGQTFETVDPVSGKMPWLEPIKHLKLVYDVVEMLIPDLIFAITILLQKKFRSGTLIRVSQVVLFPLFMIIPVSRWSWIPVRTVQDPSYLSLKYNSVRQFCTSEQHSNEVWTFVFFA